MYDGSEGNAMTEVALALAMGFFSILVLALVSMGAGSGTARDQGTPAALLQLALAQSASESSAALDSDDQLVIVHRGQLLDTNLAPVRPADLDSAKRVVLAFDPSAPLDQAMAAYNRLGRSDVVVAALDQRWRETLARLGVSSGDPSP